LCGQPLHLKGRRFSVLTSRRGGMSMVETVLTASGLQDSGPLHNQILPEAQGEVSISSYRAIVYNYCGADLPVVLPPSADRDVMGRPGASLRLHHGERAIPARTPHGCRPRYALCSFPSFAPSSRLTLLLTWYRCMTAVVNASSESAPRILSYGHSRAPCRA
jgi:hypothetical protein